MQQLLADDVNRQCKIGKFTLLAAVSEDLRTRMTELTTRHSNEMHEITTSMISSMRKLVLLFIQVYQNLIESNKVFHELLLLQKADHHDDQVLRMVGTCEALHVFNMHQSAQKEHFSLSLYKKYSSALDEQINTFSSYVAIFADKLQESTVLFEMFLSEEDVSFLPVMDSFLYSAGMLLSDDDIFKDSYHTELQKDLCKMMETLLNQRA